MAHSGRKVVHNGYVARSFTFEFGTIPGPDQDSATTERLSGADIAEFVADEPRLIEIQR
mgnify:CR=1 FL=1